MQFSLAFIVATAIRSIEYMLECIKDILLRVMVYKCQIQELKKDIVVPDYCFAGGGEMRSLNAWFGPPGTVTPLHHDPHHNILAQVCEKLYIVTD